MKNRFLQILTLALSLTATVAVKANPVDAERASRVAANFLNHNGARSAGIREVSALAGFTNLYVFTTESSFVLVAADDCVQPILGYSLTTGFVTEDMPDNARQWIEGYGTEIRSAVEQQQRASAETMRQWSDLFEGNLQVNRATVVVGPLLQTQWHQEEPFNNLCPNNTVTGCVATAMAQIMKYWNYPAHGIGWHSYLPETHPYYGVQSANFNSTYYEWTNMTNVYNSSSTYAQKQAVATLMYHCGVSVDMDYGPEGSSGVTAYAANALKTYFNYSPEAQYLARVNYPNATWLNMLKSDLNQNRPVQYSGRGSGGGHSFILDGYDTDNYFHINWGWGGFCDAYYSINNLNPGPGGTGSGANGIYNDDQGAIFGVHPSECTANDPVNLTFTLNESNLTLSWTAANGAASYNIYRDNNYVGNSATNSYTSSAPFGTSVYYVRSVDPNGRLSLSSNTVTVTVGFQTPVVDDLSASVSGYDVNLAWTAPEWCYPETPTATLSYGDGPVYYSWNYVCYGHRYLASNMAQFANKSVYKIGTYIQYPGTYTLYIYTRSNSGNRPDPNSLAATKVIEYTGSAAWLDIVLDQPVIIPGTDDLWVVMKQENTGQEYPVPSFNLNSYNPYACYGGSSPTFLYSAQNYNISWLIRTYLTDGVYTYNLYRDGSSIANDLEGTFYVDNDLPAGVYSYYVKTNYYGGESAASNMVTVQVSDPVYFPVTASANPTEGGFVTGAGTYLEGSTCTLTATANEGYTFINWTKNGEEVSTSPDYNFIVTEAGDYVANFELNSYEIIAEAFPEEGGTVEGAGIFSHGAVCTLTAIANEGYTFVNWMKDGAEIPMGAVYSFGVTEAGTYVAIFELNSYEITAEANPEEGGTVEGAGIYYFGSDATLTATANEGYTFINWMKNGEEVSTDAIFSFTVTEAAVYVANFELNSYEITVEANLEEGTVEGAGVYDYGMTCILTALANDGYTFMNWTENGEEVSTEAIYSFTVTSDRVLAANFTVAEHEPTGVINGIFTINAEGDVVLFSQGNLQYQASTNTWRFAENQYDYVGYDNLNISANYDGWIDLFGWGTSGYNHGAIAYQPWSTSETASHYSAYGNNLADLGDETGLADWGYNAIVNGGNAQNFGWRTLSKDEWTFVLNTRTTVSGLRYAKATVDDVKGLILLPNNWNPAIYTLENTNSGSASYSDNLISASDWSVLEEAGAVFMPAGGSRLGTTVSGYNQTSQPNAYGRYWSATHDNIDCAFGVNFSNYSVTGAWRMDRPLGIAVRLAYPLELLSYDIQAEPNPEDGGTVTGAGTYTQFSICTLTASANAGYIFVNWTKDGEVVSTNPTYSFDVTEPALYVANFVMGCAISATANPAIGGTVEGAGTYPYGTMLTLTAIPDEGYFFVNWTKNGSVVSTDLNYTFTVTESGEYIANFELYSHAITAIANPTLGGTVDGAGDYLHFSTCTLIATANEGYTFVNWTKDGVEVSTDASYSFTVTEAGIYVANFEMNSYAITATANPIVGGIVSGGGTYIHGATVTLIATPNAGYIFGNWTKNGEMVSTETTFSFIATEAGAYVANFSRVYEVAAIVNPNVGGTVMGAGVFNYGETATLTAIPNTGYTFINWTENGTQLSTELTCSFTVTADRTLTANFTDNPIYWTITATVDPADWGMVSGTGTYLQGQTCTLTATASTGYAFSNWTKDGAVVSTSATYSFVVAESIALVAHFEEQTDITQSTTFATGWNWWSAYVEGEDLMNQMKAGLGANGQQIKSQTQFTQYNAMLNMWMGQLSRLNNESTYMIQANDFCSMELTGAEASPANHPIVLNHGWNWIGYPNSSAMPISVAFSNITPTNQDQVKSQNGFAQYNSMLNMWIGNLNTINPGTGLQYLSTANGNITLVYPEAARNVELAENITNENNYWTNNVHAYPNNMTVTAVVELDDVELQSENYEVAAFANGECRGSAKLMYVEPLNRYMAFLTIAGDEASEVHFGLYDAQTGNVETCHGASLQYETNAVVGDAESPYVISFRSTTGVDDFGSMLHIFPNPVRRGEIVTIGLPAVEALRATSVQIVNAFGQVVETVCTPSVQTIAAPKVAGVYTLRITVEGEGTYTRKLVVR